MAGHVIVSYYLLGPWYGFRSPKPAIPTDASSVDERANYNKWIKASKVVKKIITNSISMTIRGSIEARENAKDLLEATKCQF